MTYVTRDTELTNAYGYAEAESYLPGPSSPELDETRGGTPLQKGFPFMSLVRMVIRKSWLIVIPGIVLAGYFYREEMSKPVRYQGSFQLLLEPITAEARLADPSAVTEAGVPRRDRFDVDYPTQLAILQGDGILSQIVEAVQPQYPDFDLGGMRWGLTVERVVRGRDQTQIIETRYFGLDPDFVQHVLEKTAEVYLAYSLEERRSDVGQGVQFIEGQLADLEARSAAIQQEIQQLQQQNAVIDPEDESRDTARRLDEVSAEKFAAERELSEQRILQSNLRDQLAIDPDVAIAATVLSEDPLYQNLLTQLQDINVQLAIESSRFDEQSPSIQTLLEQKSGILPLLEERRNQTLGQSAAAKSLTEEDILTFQNSIRRDLSQQLVEVTNRLGVLETRVQELAAAENELVDRLQTFPEVTRRYKQLQNELGVVSRTIDQLLSRRETLRIQQAQTEVPWELIAEPIIPRESDGTAVPTTEPDPKNVVVGLAAGLMLGFAAAFLLEKLQNIYFSTADLEETMSYPVLADIKVPRQQKRRLRARSRAGTALARSEDLGFAGNFNPFFESFNALYAKLLFLFPDPPIHSLAICSAEVNPYRTITAIRLAQIVAGMGKRVLLVDTSLRQPVLHQFLGLPNEKGLADVLSSGLSVGECIQRSDLSDNLFVLSAGETSLETAQLIGSAEMAQTIERLRTAFDYVIYETPELADTTDANFLASYMDGLLLVAEIKRTKPTDLRRVVENLTSFNMPVLGFVAVS